MRDRSWQGQKWPGFSCWCVKNKEISTPHEFGWNLVFLRKWLLGDMRVGAPCHDSGKGWHIIRIDGARMLCEFFWTEFGDPVVTMVVAFFCTALFSFCSTMRVHRKKWAMQPHFLMLPPCGCIAKTINNFVWGATFENQMFDFGGIEDSIFQWKEKKSWVMWVKMDESKVGVNRKYVPYTYLKNTYSSTYLCTPYLYSVININKCM